MSQKDKPTTTSYNLINIRNLLASGLSDEVLRRFCYDTPSFKAVYDRLTQDTGKDQLIDRLIEQGERTSQLEILLAFAEEHNPTAYEKHQPYAYPSADQLQSDEAHHRLQGAARPSDEAWRDSSFFQIGEAMSFKSEQGSASEPDQDLTPMDLVQVQLLDEDHSLGEAQQKALFEALASVCQLSPDRLQLVEAPTNSPWLGLAMPKPEAERLVRLFDTSDDNLLLLLTKFRIKQISLLPVTGLAHLELKYTSLVRRLYLGAGRVIIEQELGGGYGGARVFLAQPINQQGNPMARQIIKIGRGAELLSERDNSRRYVEKDLPLIAARLDNYAKWAGLAGITNSFVGGGLLGKTRTFEDYYRDPDVSTEAIIQTLKGLLDEALGQSWYSHSRSYLCPFAEEYGSHLVEHLRLRLRPASADGIWPVAQTPKSVEGYSRLAGEQVGSVHGDISPGTLVQVEGLTIGKIKSHELKLQHPTNPGVVVKVECEPGSIFSVGDEVIVRGEVMYNRPGRLEQIVTAAFSDFPEAAVDVKQAQLAWGPDDHHYPNPLHIYPEILSKTLRGRRSMVHGDLHLRNILVDQHGRGWLIDFARVAERHSLYDFIKLETYIRQMILSKSEYKFSFVTYLQFEEALTSRSLGLDAAPPEDTDLRRAYQVILALREMATHYMKYPPDIQAEYFPTLFLYNLAVLKYYDNHGDKAVRLAFAAAAVIGKAIEQTGITKISGHQGQNPTSAEDYDNTGKNEPSRPPSGPPVSKPYRVYDSYTPYEIRVEELLKRIGQDHPNYHIAFSQYQLLNENIIEARQYLDTKELRVQRVQIVTRLNMISLSTLGISFDELYKP